MDIRAYSSSRPFWRDKSSPPILDASQCLIGIADGG